MGLRAKSRQRLTIMVSCVLAASLIGGGSYMAMHAYRVKITAEGKPKGLAAYKAGEWVAALNYLGPYLQAYPDDVEAIEAYATVRLRLVEPDGKHLSQAMNQYRRLVALKPDVLDYKRALADLYYSGGMNTELLQQTDEILTQVIAAVCSGDAAAQKDLRDRLLGPATTDGGASTARQADADDAGGKIALAFKAQADKRLAAGESAAEVQKKYLDPLEETLKLRVKGQIRLRRWYEAKVGAAVLNTLTPGVDTLALDLAVRSGNQEPDDLVAQRAEMLTAGMKNDAAVQIFKAMFYGNMASHAIGDDQARWSKASLAAAELALAAPRSSDQVVVDLANLLDRLERFADAEKVLEEGRAKFQTDLLEEEHLRRLIYQERYEQAAGELAKIDAAKRPLVAGLRVVALCEWARKLAAAGSPDEAAQKKQEAQASLETLKECGARWDFVAQGWHDVLELKYFTKDAPERDMIDACRKAAARETDNPFFHEFLGDAYQASGDPTAALPQWDGVHVLAPAWAMPLAREAHYYAAIGDVVRAYLMARLAEDRMPEDKGILESVVVSWRGALGAQGVGGPEELLAYIRQHSRLEVRFARTSWLSPFRLKYIAQHSQLAVDDATVPLEISLLVALKRPEEAAARIHQLTAAVTAPDALVLLSAAIAAHDLKLPADLEGECLAKYQQLKGVTPDLAGTQARFLLQEALNAEYGGRKAEADAKAAADKGDAAESARQAGLAKTAAADAASKRQQAKVQYEKQKAENDGQPGSDVEGWDTGWCMLLETIKDPAAHDAWAALIRKHAGSSKAQWAAAAAGSVRLDHALLGQALDRLAAIGGESGLTWRLEKGLWLLEDRAQSDNLGQAVKFTTQTVNTWPESIPARKLLARSFALMNNLPNAILELSRAADRAPDDVDIKLDLADFYERQKDNARAIEQVRRVASSPRATPAQRTRGGVLAAHGGDSDLAVMLLEGSKSDAAAQLLPGMYWQRGDMARALEGYKSALAANPPLELVEQSLSFFAATANSDQAQLALDALGRMDVPEATRHAVRGSYLAMIHKTDDAVTELSAALQEDPKNDRVWRRLLATQILAGRVEEALKSANAAAAALPGDPARDALLKLGAAGLADPDVRNYLTDCILFPQQNRGLSEAVQMIQSAPGDNAKQAQQLALVAGRNQNSLSLQLLTIRKYMLANRLDDALSLARRAMLNDPSAMEPAELATLCLAAKGRWDEALATAQNWRTLAHGSGDADLLIASAFVRLFRNNDAIKLLQPYVNANIPDERAYRAVVLLLAAAELQAGQVDDAEKLVWPIVEKNPAWRDDWGHLASDSMPAEHVADAERWVRKLAGVTAADDVAGQIAVVQAWHRLFKRFKVQAAGDEALKTAQRLAALDSGDPVQRSRADVIMGNLREELGDPKTAEQFYRLSLKLNPTFDIALNDLAVVLTKNPALDAAGHVDAAATRARLDEALKLAQQALAITPQQATFYDTLAATLAALQRYDEALANLDKAVAMDPANPEWLIAMAETQVAAKRMDAAVKTLKKAEILEPNLVNLSDIKKRDDEAFVSLKRRHDVLKETLPNAP